MDPNRPVLPVVGANFGANWRGAESSVPAALRGYPKSNLALSYLNYVLCGPLFPQTKEPAHGLATQNLSNRLDGRTMGYPGCRWFRQASMEAWLKEERPNWRIEVKTRPEGTRGFTPLEKRWVVERTNAWNGRCRRNSKDYERRTESSTAMIQISNIHLMLRRLSPGSRPAFHYQAAA